MMPDSMTHAPESGIKLTAPISGTSFWSTCQGLYNRHQHFLYKPPTKTHKITAKKSHL